MTYEITNYVLPQLLPRKHRAWVALYSIENSQYENKAEVLQKNDLIEADLTEFEESWLRLRGRPAGLIY